MSLSCSCGDDDGCHRRSNEDNTMMPTLPQKVCIGVGYFDEYLFAYTENQMREYASACVRAERERCAKACGSRYLAARKPTANVGALSPQDARQQIEFLPQSQFDEACEYLSDEFLLGMLAVRFPNLAKELAA